MTTNPNPDPAAVSVVPPATNQTAEEHRLALSEALGLGTGAPWDAIHDRVTELGLPPLDRDPVARRLGLLAAPVDRAAVLREAAELVAALDRRKTVIHADTIRDAWEEGRDEGADLLRRLAAEAPHAETPDVRTVAAYSDGKGRVFCLACPRPEAVDVPVTVEDVDPWELCPSCGRHVVDVARAAAPAVVAQPGKEPS